MAFTPDIRWMDFIQVIESTDEEGVAGGYSYYEMVNGKGRMVLGTVITLDFSDFDPTVNKTSATAMIKTVFEFANGVKCKVGVWYPHNWETVTYAYCRLKYWWEDSQGTVVQGSGFNKEDQYDLDVNLTYDTRVSMLKENGLKCAFITNYAATQTPPTENLTNPTYFELMLYAPLHIIPDQNLKINDLHMLQSHSVISIKQDQYLPYLNDEVAPIQIALLRTSNLETLFDKLDNYGDIKDPFKVGNANDPSQESDPSSPGGGDGNYDDTSDPIDFPNLPANGALSSGSIKAFLVGAGTMTSFFLKLWDASIFDIATYQKLLEEPLSALVDLLAVPVLPNTTTAQSIKLGNFDTEITAPVVTQQYVKVNLGSLKVGEYWGSAMDYSPYTKAEIFLPFIGIRSLNIDDVMNNTLEVEYNMDILTGDLVANIKCGKSVLYKYNGNAKETIPVSSRVNEKMQKIVSGLGGVTGAAMGGGSFAAAAISAGVNVAFSKRNITRSGDIQGVPGILDDFVPYLIIHRPVQSLPADFKKFKGYPSNIRATLNSLSGYVEVEYIHLDDIAGATDTELEEIETLLKQGVII